MNDEKSNFVIPKEVYEEFKEFFKKNDLKHYINLTDQELAKIERFSLSGLRIEEDPVRSLKIDDIPSSIYHFKNLKELYLYKNNLHELPGELALLNSLETINISDNPFNGIPEVIKRLINIKKLIASNINIKELSADFFNNFNRLEWLDLSNNNISELPDSIDNLKVLKFLYLYNNKFNEIPEFVTHLPNLRELNLSENYITKIPDWIYDKKFNNLTIFLLKTPINDSIKKNNMGPKINV